MLNGRSVYFQPFGTYDQRCILGTHFEFQNIPDSYSNEFITKNWRQKFFHCYFADQEPFFEYTKNAIDSKLIVPKEQIGPAHIKILANSEKSQLLSNYIKDENFYNWYYFYHGFAALDWYKNFQYIDSSSFNRFDKVFICYNNLISNLRSYRLHLVANLINNDLLTYGLVSLRLQDSLGTWQDTVEDPNNPLDYRARVKIVTALSRCSGPLIIDTEQPTGSLSAELNLDVSTRALFYIVTETIYFDPKLHLTEKIFKPIVARRPFFLVAAPGNLAYLKRYGFRTFDQWIDESYDEETDHYIRIEKITAEIKRLCAMDPKALEQMYLEMQETLDYNFNHFYTGFKDLIVDELVDNFDDVLKQVNHGRIPGNHSRYHVRFELEPDYLDEVKKRLKQ
jgi:hypothetical protein